jgi:hypothetical protein
VAWFATPTPSTSEAVTRCCDHVAEPVLTRTGHGGDHASGHSGTSHDTRTTDDAQLRMPYMRGKSGGHHAPMWNTWRSLCERSGEEAGAGWPPRNTMAWPTAVPEW